MRNTPRNHDSCNMYTNRTPFLVKWCTVVIKSNAPYPRRRTPTCACKHKWCICDIYYLHQHRAMATISVYIVILYSRKLSREKSFMKVLKLKILQKKMCILQLKVRHAPIKWWHSDKTIEIKRLDKYDRQHYGTMMPFITTTTSTQQYVHAHTAQRLVSVSLTVGSSSTTVGVPLQGYRITIV